ESRLLAEEGIVVARRGAGPGDVADERVVATLLARCTRAAADVRVVVAARVAQPGAVADEGVVAAQELVVVGAGQRAREEVVGAAVAHDAGAGDAVLRRRVE